MRQIADKRAVGDLVRGQAGAGRRRGGQLRVPCLVAEALESRWLLAAFTSDDFNATQLNTSLWTYVNPLGDAALTMDGTRAVIAVPAGQAHDPWKTNSAPRLMQAAQNTDFQIEVKFESMPVGTYSSQGVIVQASASTFLRFDFISRGTAGSMYAYSASIANGTATKQYDSMIAEGVPLYMRVTRQGNQWTQSYSYNGADWINAASYSYSLAVTQVGVFAGNAGKPAPANTVGIDYFFNTAAPITPEDANWSLDQTAPLIYDWKYDNRTNQVQLSWWTNEPTTSVVDFGTSSSYGGGSVVDSVLSDFHTVTLNMNELTTYHYRIRSTNANGLTSVSRDLLVRSGGVPQAAPVIDVWYGANQSFGGLGTTQRWANVPGRVYDPDGVSSFTYSLNGNTATPITIGPDGLRLVGPGDFNPQIALTSLASGNNTLVLTATDTLGNTSTRIVTLNYTPGQTWPANFTADWSTATQISDLAQVVDGLWTLDGDTLRVVEGGYDRLVALGDIGWTDYELTVPITINGFFPGSNSPGLGIILGWSGHYGAEGGMPGLFWYPVGALGWYRHPGAEMISNGSTVLAEGPSDYGLQVGTTYLYKMRVESVPNAPSVYKLKIWQQGTTEPTGWGLTGQGLSDSLRAGSAVLIAHRTDATFGRVEIRQVTDNVPPAIQNVAAAPTPSQATVTWTTSEMATGIVQYGLTTSYELGSVSQGQFATNHSVTLSDLLANTTYHFRILATDTSGNSASTGDYTFSTGSGTVTGGPVSDDFHSGTLNTDLWTFVNPLGDGSVTMDGTRALISVPAGTDHDVWTAGNRAPRLMQWVTNTDFEIEAKFESIPAGRYAIEGLLVEADVNNVLRFDFHSDGTNLRIFAASLANGTSSVKVNSAIASGAALYLRVRRQGNQWTLSYSYNGTSWTQAVSFSYGLAVTRVGVFAGNSGKNPAFTAAVDYFFNTASPIVPEDGAPQGAPVIGGISSQVAATQATINWTTDQATTGVVEYGLTDSYELGSVSSGQSATSHSVTLTGLEPGATYHYRIVATNGVNVNTTSSDQAFTTISGTSGIRSDDFSNGALDTGTWTFVNPVGDGSVTMDGTRALISAPAGTSHDLWTTGNFAPRLMQAAPNTDFEIEVKFESAPTGKYAMQGLVIEASPGVFLRFEFYSDSNSLRVYAAILENGTATAVYNKAITAGAALYMRVRRQGDQWTQAYSLDGVAWTTAANFAYAMAVTQVGVYAGNSGRNAPAFTAAVDYFFNTASPIVPEDGAP